MTASISPRGGDGGNGVVDPPAPDMLRGADGPGGLSARAVCRRLATALQTSTLTADVRMPAASCKGPVRTPRVAAETASRISLDCEVWTAAAGVWTPRSISGADRSPRVELRAARRPRLPGPAGGFVSEALCQARPSNGSAGRSRRSGLLRLLRTCPCGPLSSSVVAALDLVAASPLAGRTGPVLGRVEEPPGRADVRRLVGRPSATVSARRT